MLNQTYVALSGIAALVLAGFLLYWPPGGYEPPAVADASLRLSMPLFAS